MAHYYGLRRRATREELLREKRSEDRVSRQLLVAPYPVSGEAWEGVKAQNAEIAQEDLALLLSLVIDFWWSGEVLCSYEDGPYEKRVHMRLGPKHRLECAAEYGRTVPAQYTPLVRGQTFLVTDKDIVERDGTLWREREWVEVGVCPAAEFSGDHYHGENMRESAGYRPILHLPVNDAPWRPPPRPQALVSDEAIEAYRHGDEAYQQRYDDLAKTVDRQEMDMRARVMLGRAWKFQFLLRLWCGISITEEEWTSALDQVLSIPTTTPEEKGRSEISWESAIERFGGDLHLAQTDGLPDTLQIMILLQLADQKRRGESGPLVDPLNPNGRPFVQALNQFKDLPGLRTMVSELRTIDKSRRRRPRRDNYEAFDY